MAASYAISKPAYATLASGSVTVKIVQGIKLFGVATPA
jgi:hypothetical protein